MAKIIDACGLTCPAPVLLVKDCVEKEQLSQLTVVVDNDASRENVTRFLNSRGYSVTPNEIAGNFELKASRDDEFETEQLEENTAHADKDSQKHVVMIMTDRMGRGDDELGKKLLINYIKTLKEMGPDLWQIIFVNSGVKLTVKSSPVIENLQDYQTSGVSILACGTCLEHFNLLTEKAVGDTTNMLDIVTATQLADKVITIS
ncbi:sulfurtransferase-like selenium metabolism protein YedF [Desulfosediminicola flagellatus]|uniref:sulfurtransferase-like selenium metabolism protein YedF n=1 Tax=Desulfosediminicola flagellatus TaxID=2569541 RepID=UPI0010AC8739|nr:sulfurtransferase-like selenium metabolism protein YedF [Desulfosediminicola flagellatus]